MYNRAAVKSTRVETLTARFNMDRVSRMSSNRNPWCRYANSESKMRMSGWENSDAPLGVSLPVYGTARNLRVFDSNPTSQSGGRRP